jgi:hypothetical protein
VPGHAFDVPRVQATESGAYCGVEVADVHPVGDLRARRQRRTPLRRRYGGPPGATCRAATAVVGGTPFAPATAVAAGGVRALGSVTGPTLALRTTVLPLRPVTCGPVPLRTTVLPLRPVPLRTATLGALLPLTRRVP